MCNVHHNFFDDITVNEQEIKITFNLNIELNKLDNFEMCAVGREHHTMRHPFLPSARVIATRLTALHRIYTCKIEINPSGVNI